MHVHVGYIHPRTSIVDMMYCRRASLAYIHFHTLKSGIQKIINHIMAYYNYITMLIGTLYTTL